MHYDIIVSTEVNNFYMAAKISQILEYLIYSIFQNVNIVVEYLIMNISNGVVYKVQSAKNVPVFPGILRKIAHMKTQQITDKASKHNGRK